MSKFTLITPPVTPLEKLTMTFKQSLDLPDPGPLQVLLGAVAANMTEGVPVWLMMIGSPSCGKTELLNSLLDIPNQIDLADLSNESAFLSATPSRERGMHSTGGILRQIGASGGVVFNDFTTVLSRPDRLTGIMSALREIYGGRWIRHVGAEGGRMLQWRGKMAAYAGCTPEIDQHHSLSTRLGERWINYRFEPREDYYAATRSNFDQNRPKDWRKLLSEAVAEFFDTLCLSYQTPLACRSFTAREQEALYELANMAVHCRSGVPRDGYNHEINGYPDTEIPTRFSLVLAQLLDGLGKVGVSEEQCWRLLFRVYMDSMPKLRKIVVETVQREPITVEELTVPMGCGLSTAQRVIQDLEAHKVIHRKRGVVTLTDWMKKGYSRMLYMAKQVGPALVTS